VHDQIPPRHHTKYALVLWKGKNTGYIHKNMEFDIQNIGG
jgi:hypothetical protein